MLVGGIDEARRGPVIGPMTICLALATRENEEKLRVMGVKDSKLLTPAQRERLAVEIRKLCKIHLAKVTAKHLNEQMKLKSLNAIEADYMTELIKGIPKKDWGELELIYIDVPVSYPLEIRAAARSSEESEGEDSCLAQGREVPNRCCSEHNRQGDRRCGAEED